MDMDDTEKIKQFAKIFFNKIIDELDKSLAETNFADFLKKKHLSVSNEKKETVYGKVILNIIFAVEYVLKIDPDEADKLESIIKKLESKKSETDKMLSSVIEAEMGLMEENFLAIFSTDCFDSFIVLLEIETGIKIKKTISEMLSGIIISFFKINNIASYFNPPPFVEFLKKNTTLN